MPPLKLLPFNNWLGNILQQDSLACKVTSNQHQYLTDWAKNLAMCRLIDNTSTLVHQYLMGSIRLKVYYMA